MEKINPKITKAEKLIQEIQIRNNLLLSLSNLPYPILGWIKMTTKCPRYEYRGFTCRKTRDKYLIQKLSNLFTM